ncbi:GntR family transcriptional regulator [Enemella evansiae]|uniref:GntR family transcriptional regulator n=1 Tax=Enemella evansiae TaxID=2016499 RepID=UPI000B964DC6|nr:GntR family transcriptional regulator [Enemella evansiae]OYO00014.1 transcriptional regulator [Enemella evansiae]OYO01374.1 transcriptional regulator [Enemella evansiae]OYO07375.1 transcriptional regulator [Enemella evansiae]PFG67422.1 GntR family transcriptional regulator [Propionibacteriaceae bacterium ES.041]
MSGRAKYLVIAELLRTAIDTGELAPGAALPSQRELAEAHGVTVMTVRQALARLTEQQLIVSEHGRGTFVAPRAFALPLGPLASLVDEAAAAGRTLTTTVLDHGSAVQAGEAAYLIRRLRHLDGEPFALQTSRLPLEAAAQIDPERLTDRALYAVLAEAGLEVVAASERIHAVNLDADAAALLGRAPGAAALLSIRESRTADGTTVLTDHAQIPGDLGVVSAERARLQPLPRTKEAS